MRVVHSLQCAHFKIWQCLPFAPSVAVREALEEMRDLIDNGSVFDRPVFFEHVTRQARRLGTRSQAPAATVTPRAASQPRRSSRSPSPLPPSPPLRSSPPPLSQSLQAIPLEQPTPNPTMRRPGIASQGVVRSVWAEQISRWSADDCYPRLAWRMLAGFGTPAIVRAWPFPRCAAYPHSCGASRLYRGHAVASGY